MGTGARTSLAGMRVKQWELGRWLSDKELALPLKLRGWESDYPCPCKKLNVVCALVTPALGMQMETDPWKPTGQLV